MDFTGSEADWQFSHIMNDGICSSVELLECSWSGIGVMLRVHSSCLEVKVESTVGVTGVHKCVKCWESNQEGTGGMSRKDW